MQRLIFSLKICGARPAYIACSRSRRVAGEEVVLGQLMKVDGPLRFVKNGIPGGGEGVGKDPEIR